MVVLTALEEALLQDKTGERHHHYLTQLHQAGQSLQGEGQEEVLNAIAAAQTIIEILTLRYHGQLPSKI